MAIVLSFYIAILMSLSVEAAVPERSGNILDNAKLFPEDKIEEINLAASQQYNSSIIFNILTIESLDGQSSVDYATEVFNSWELKENDVLILMSKADRRIEINFKNPSFLTNINKLPPDYDNDGIISDSRLEEMINKHFIPYAMNDDFASGVISFMISFHQINTVDNFDASASKTETSQITPSEFTGNEEIINRDYFEKIIKISIQFILGIIVGWVIIQIFTKRKRKKFKLLNLKKVNQELLSKIKNTQEDVKSLTNNFKGSTNTDLYVVSKNLNSLSSKTSSIHNELDKMRTPLLGLKLFESTLREKNKDLCEIESNFTSISNLISKLKHLEQGIFSLNDKLLLSLEHLQEEMNRIPKNTELHRAFSDIQRQFETLQNFRIHDLESIDTDMKIISSNIDTLKVKINRIPELYQELNSAPQRITNFKGQIDRLLTDNGFKLIEFNPYIKIDEAERVLKLFERALNEGEFEEANQYSKDFSRNLRASIDQIQERISLKEQIENDIKYIDKLNSNIGITDDQFNEIYIGLRELLSEKHWIGLPEKYKGYRNEHLELQNRIQEIKELASISVQKYLEANEKLKTVSVKLSEIESKIDTLKNSVEFFTNKIQTSQLLFKTSSIRLREASERAMRADLHSSNPSLSLLIEKCLNQKDILEKLVMIKPYDMELIDLEISQYVSNIEVAENTVEQIIRNITKVERRQVRTRKGANGYRNG